MNTREVETRMLRYSMARAIDVMQPADAIQAVLAIAVRHERFGWLPSDVRLRVEQTLSAVTLLTAPFAPGSIEKEG